MTHKQRERLSFSFGASGLKLYFVFIIVYAYVSPDGFLVRQLLSPDCLGGRPILLSASQYPFSTSLLPAETSFPGWALCSVTILPASFVAEDRPVTPFWPMRHVVSRNAVSKVTLCLVSPFALHHFDFFLTGAAILETRGQIFTD